MTLRIVLKGLYATGCLCMLMSNYEIIFVTFVHNTRAEIQQRLNLSFYFPPAISKPASKPRFHSNILHAPTTSQNRFQGWKKVAKSQQKATCTSFLGDELIGVWKQERKSWTSEAAVAALFQRLYRRPSIISC